MASAHVDRGIALIVAAGASAFFVGVTPALAADPAPDPPPTETAPTPDPAPVPEPAPTEPEPSPLAPAPTPSSSPPASSSASGTQTSGSVTSSSTKRDGGPAKRKHRKVTHRSKSEAQPAGLKWQRARNDALAGGRTAPIGAPEAVAVRASVSSNPSSAPFLPAALVAALATLLLAAVPSYALDASRILRPVADLRFELATIGICILVGIVVAKGFPS